MDSPTQSAVIVTVPAAEDAVGEHRARFDWSAARGVPAHVTVVYPFVPPADIDSAVVTRLATVLAGVPRFRATWAATGWFGTEVLWLDPQPADRFRALTAAVVEAFPAFLPYGGVYDEVTPHLTVGHGVVPALLRAVEDEIRPRLPIVADVTAAALWSGSDAAGSWRQLVELPLG